MYCVVLLCNVIMYVAWCTSGTIKQKNISQEKKVLLVELNTDQCIVLYHYVMLSCTLLGVHLVPLSKKTYPRRKSVHLFNSTLINVLCCTAMYCYHVHCLMYIWYHQANEHILGEKVFTCCTQH